MTPEDSQRLEACLLEAAEILYRNTKAEELRSFQSLESSTNQGSRASKSKIAFFLLDKSQVQTKVEQE